MIIIYLKIVDDDGLTLIYEYVKCIGGSYAYEFQLRYSPNTEK